MRKSRPILAAIVAGLALASALLTFVPAASAAPGAPPPTAHNGGQGKVELNSTSGLFEGTYISLMVPSADALIESYASDGIVFFARVAIPGYALAQKSISGSTVQVTGSLAEAQVHDTPSSALKIMLAESAAANFELGAGVTAAVGPNETVVLAVAASNRSATLWGDCALSIAGDARSVAASAGASCTVFFRSQVFDTASEILVSAAAESGLLSAEVYVGEDAVGGSDVSTFGDTTVIVAHAGDRIVVSIDSSGSAPASVVIHFAAPGAEATTQILVDGRPANSADGLTDALDPSNDGTDVEYALTPNGSTSMLVVSMPTAGSHVIEFQSVGFAPTAPPPGAGPLLGIALAAALVAAAAAALFRRR